jgi:hypothetical protein
MKRSARGDWPAFLEANASTLRRAGLEPSDLEHHDRWSELLCHGYHATRADGPRVADLDDERYEALLAVVEAYFSARFEYFDPLALRDADRAWLASKFDR